MYCNVNWTGKIIMQYVFKSTFYNKNNSNNIKKKQNQQQQQKLKNNW